VPEDGHSSGISRGSRESNSPRDQRSMPLPLDYRVTLYVHNQTPVVVHLFIDNQTLIG